MDEARPTTERLAALEDLYDEIWGATRAEDPQLVRRKLVPGSLDSDVFLVAQALAEKTQRLSGYPYCYPDEPPRLSRGGNVLDEFLGRFGYTVDPSNETRRYAYHSDIGHLYPGRKPTGGDILPNADEIRRGRPWLLQEIELVQPRLLITLGKPASLELLRIYARVAKHSLAEVLGQRFELQLGNLTLPMLATYHPSGAFQHPKSSIANYEWVARKAEVILR